jgi:hypothetical protein
LARRRSLLPQQGRYCFTSAVSAWDRLFQRTHLPVPTSLKNPVVTFSEMMLGQATWMSAVGAEFGLSTDHGFCGHDGGGAASFTGCSRVRGVTRPRSLFDFKAGLRHRRPAVFSREHRAIGKRHRSALTFRSSFACGPSAKHGSDPAALLPPARFEPCRAPFSVRSHNRERRSSAARAVHKQLRTWAPHS